MLINISQSSKWLNSVHNPKTLLLFTLLKEKNTENIHI